MPPSLPHPPQVCHPVAFWMLAITIAPVGGAGTLPLFPDPEPDVPVVPADGELGEDVGVEVEDELEEVLEDEAADVPAELGELDDPAVDA